MLVPSGGEDRPNSMPVNIFAKKDLRAVIAESQGETGGLKRALGAFNLITLGVGAIIGTGIFVLTGPVAATTAGPAIVLSFVIAAIACAFAGLCYAEFASLLPIAGSSYSYSYTTLGEVVAWIIGWALILEYGFGAATVAVGWSGYIASFLQDLGVHVPPAVAGAPGTQMVLYHGHWERATALAARLHLNVAALPHVQARFDLMALIGILLMTAVLFKGIQESANLNTAIVVLKVSVLLIFIGLGAEFLFAHWSAYTVNWHPFIPKNAGAFGEFGWSGVLRGAGQIFFAYIGFDAVSTAAQEAKNPQRDMPVGILGSLVVCTILYILVAVILTGLVPYTHLNVPDPVAVGIDVTGVRWGSFLVKIGAIGGLTSTMLVMLLGQTRVFFTMAHDGLLWSWAGKVHPRFRTPYIVTIVVGLCVALLAASLPISTLDELTSVGTLFAFTVVCAGIWVLRRQRPELERPFRTPWVPFVPIMGMVVSLAMMVSLHALTWKVFIAWLIAGLIVYALYGSRHSHVQQALEVTRQASAK